MPRVRILPRAKIDLLEIWNYIADDSVARADAFVDKLSAKMRALGRRPRAGRDRAELGPGIRSLPFGQYVIFYRVVARYVEIVRVLHGARDIETMF